MKSKTEKFYGRRSQSLKKYISSTLFNSYYLEKGFPEHFEKSFIPIRDKKFKNFYDGFIAWVKNQDISFFTETRPSEETTIDRYIIPVMGFLAWDKVENVNSDRKSRNKTYQHGDNNYRPDIVYFHKEEDARKIDKLKIKNQQKLHCQKTHSIVLEAKKFGFLKQKDVVDKKSDSTKGKTPEEQTITYMDILHSKFGILTDGGIWKFFHKEFRDEGKYFSFDLNKLCLLTISIQQDVNLEINLSSKNRKIKDLNFLLAYFYNIFSYQALHGNLKTVSHLIDFTKKYSNHLEDKMKDRFIIAMNYACNGFYKSIKKSEKIVENKNEIIRRTAESHLFNLIFFRSLESRGILPYYDEDNAYKKYSVSKMVDYMYEKGFNPYDDLDKQLKLFTDHFEQKVEKDTYVIYDSLLQLYKKVQHGVKGFQLKGFKESVFTKEEWKFANTFKIDDQHIKNIIFYLNFIPKEKELEEYQLIPFDFLTPREVGSIYESFLEFKLEKTSTPLYWNFKKKQWVKNKENAGELFPKEIIKKGQYVFTPNNRDKKVTGGFYTPHYIVKFITESILDKLCEGKKPEEILKLTICDPAMGSGHFINYALDYLAGKYIDAHNKFDIPLNETPGKIKLKIIDNCIYGVDINPSAVKLAKMSLWLNTAKECDKLSPLDKQIIEGDSLTTFDWHKKFNLVFKNGGFSSIIGNPPYIFTRGKLTHQKKEFFKKEYETQQYQSNTFSLFIERSVKLLKENGYLGFIVPDTCLTISSLSQFRKFMLDEGNFEVILRLQYRVFEQAGVEPIVFIYQKSFKKIKSCDTVTLKEQHELNDLKYKKIEIKLWQKDSENRLFFISQKTDEIINKIETISTSLEKLFIVKAGLQAYETRKGNPVQTSEDVKKRIYDYTFKKNNNTYKYLDGKNIKPFTVDWGGTWLEYGKNLAAPRTFNLFSKPRVLVLEIPKKYPSSLITTYTDKIYLNNRSIINILPGEKTDKDDLKVLSLILSSNLISFYFINKTPKAQRKLFPKIILRDLIKFPIILPKEKNHKLMLELANELHTSNLKTDKSRFEEIINEANQIVNSMYGFSKNFDFSKFNP